MSWQGKRERELISGVVRDAIGPSLLTVPAPLHAIARHVGVAAVLNSNGGSGCVDLTAPRPVVRLAADMSANRRRFTLGHELGHIVVHRRAEQLRSVLYGDDQVERVCDRVAVELLLPLCWVSPLADRAWCLSELEQFARTAEVSVAALVNRLSDLGGPTVWLRAQRVRNDIGSWTNEWCVTERAGAKGPFRQQVALGQDSCNGLSDVGDGLHRRVVHMDVAGRTASVEVSLRKRAGNVWMCFSRRPRTGSRPGTVRADRGRV